MTKRTASAAAFIAGLAMMAAAGCAEPGERDGPYSHDLELASQNGSDFVDRVLADGKISDAEMAEVNDRYVSCMADLGFTAQVQVDARGKSSYHVTLAGEQTEAESNAADASCLQRSDMVTLGVLYDSMRTNPQNEDFEQLTLDCLEREGVLVAGVRTEDVAEYLAQGDIDPAIFDQCTQDPLGLLSGEK